MSSLKRKFELIQRLQNLGFTFEESQQLRRISLTLHRWAEAECNGEIERNEETGKPWARSGNGASWMIADREGGALTRLKAIVDARNARERSDDARRASYAGHVLAFNQTDPRGCSLYLLRRVQVRDWTDDQIRKHSGEYPLKSQEARERFLLEMSYSNGLAVTA